MEVLFGGTTLEDWSLVAIWDIAARLFGASCEHALPKDLPAPHAERVETHTSTDRGRAFECLDRVFWLCRRAGHGVERNP